MRLPVLAALFLTVASAAAADTPNARSAYVERRGLIESDAQCRLFSPGIRAALESGATQARGALLRAGWSTAQVRELESAVVVAARSRACNDDRTLASAADARAAFATWVNAGAMRFPGWERAWVARRVVAADGWRLIQSIDAPIRANFGVRDNNGIQRLVLVVPLSGAERAPRAVRLLMRDADRAPLVEISLPQRVAYGLAAGVPSPGGAASFPSARSVEPLGGGRSQAVFAFPDTAFRNLLALDPRESLELRLEDGVSTRRVLVEVGDIAAARAFLTIRAG